jgi:hypothetical protein
VSRHARALSGGRMGQMSSRYMSTSACCFLHTPPSLFTRPTAGRSCMWLPTRNTPPPCPSPLLFSSQIQIQFTPFPPLQPGAPAHLQCVAGLVPRGAPLPAHDSRGGRGVPDHCLPHHTLPGTPQGERVLCLYCGGGGGGRGHAWVCLVGGDGPPHLHTHPHPPITHTLSPTPTHSPTHPHPPTPHTPTPHPPTHPPRRSWVTTPSTSTSWPTPG